MTILILYATREGHTQRVAEHLELELRSLGRSAELIDAGHVPELFRLARYDGAILAASVHLQRHEKEMIEFVKSNRRQLERMPTAFISVSLSEAGAENRAATKEQREQGSNDARRMIDAFFEETGWEPDLVKPVAGALLYTKYNFVVRFVMKQIARRAGGSTDTSRDHEYTNWVDLDRFVQEFLTRIPPPAASLRGSFA